MADLEDESSQPQERITSSDISEGRTIEIPTEYEVTPSSQL